jgi:hypothetical protein
MRNRPYALIIVAALLAVIVVVTAIHGRGGGWLNGVAQAIHGHR